MWYKLLRYGWYYKNVCIIACAALELFRFIGFWQNYFGSSILIIYDLEYYGWCNEKRKIRRSTSTNAVQQSLLSGAETVKVCLYRSNAKRMIENKNNEIEKDKTFAKLSGKCLRACRRYADIEKIFNSCGRRVSNL